MGMPHGVPIPSRGHGQVVESSALFDPKDYSVDDVMQHLRDYPADSQRVLDLEAAGKGRKGILANWEPAQVDDDIGAHLDNAAGIESLAGPLSDDAD
jgi:hypothetical protein